MNTFLFKGMTKKGSSLPPLDGFNIWNTISEGNPSPRTEILHNIDVPPSSNDFSDVDNYEGIAIRVGDMKLLMGVPNLTWYKPPELSSERQPLDEVKCYCKLFLILIILAILAFIIPLLRHFTIFG